MNRIQEKVKDVVEVRPYTNLQDYLSDPAETLSAYHFTDATSELMAKWLNKVENIQTENGAAIALAGYRGVGKSHFLATFGAIAANPDLRLKITDQHVAIAAQQIKRRRHPVAYVRRGTHATLLDELKDALAKATETEAADLGNSLPELLQAAAGRAPDVPFLIVIDTAGERVARVARDDGAFLGEIAERAKKLNILVAVALDDDISGADGVNAGIARNYTIDFLDQEHLYRIVDKHVFPKHRQMQSLLHDIYTNFRDVSPSFRWSEPRFSSLYPLHPVILDNASFVRLYVPDFALLGFASEAGAKILGRPANSLIGLDEVFDRVENSLRKVDVLKESFQTYDHLNSQVITQIPVMQRLQAKLILKALMLLSLDGDGTTAGEISAAMLIYDEADPPQAIKTVGELLESFVSAQPEAIARVEEEGREIRYSLKISGKDDLMTALGEAAKAVPPAVIPKILLRLAREKFPDWMMPEEDGAAAATSEIWTDSEAVWRGGTRRGRLFWNLENRQIGSPAANAEFLDWEVIINSALHNSENAGEIPRVYWKHAPLRRDEAETILRYFVLQTDQNFAENPDEQIHAAKHTHTLAVEKIWNRIFIEEAKFVIDGFDYNFTEEARAAQNLSVLFSIMLEPLFETHYPNHPYFARTLGMPEVSSLVNDFFSGAKANFSEVQELAAAFALPLSLVAPHGTAFILEKEENIINLPLAQEILHLVNESGAGKTVSLKTVYRKLKQSPFGLAHEAQHLILTALVAQRQIEFVTSKGDRINRRSLDLKIIWDDIEGVAKPESIVYSDKKLSDWARILTGADALPPIGTPENSHEIGEALKVWLADWKTARLLERFDELPDEVLNTKIWRLAANAEKTFGVTASTVELFADESISLEEALHRIADAFSDSEKEFFARAKDLITLEDFTGGIGKREKIWSYLAVCETTQDEKTEYFRDKLLELISESCAAPDEATNREMENLWQTFHTRFTEHFAVKHDLVMKSYHLEEKFDEIRRSDEWWEFETLSCFSIFPEHHWKKAQAIIRRLENLNCRFDAREMLKTHPFCACSFNLEKIREWERLPQNLFEIINRGRESYRKILRLLSETVISSIEQFARQSRDEDFAEAASHLIEILQSADKMPLLTNNELIILQKIFETLPTSPLLNLDFPTENNYLDREQMRLKINDWVDEMPNKPVLVRV